MFAVRSSCACVCVCSIACFFVSLFLSLVGWLFVVIWFFFFVWLLGAPSGVLFRYLGEFFVCVFCICGDLELQCGTGGSISSLLDYMLLICYTFGILGA